MVTREEMLEKAEKVEKLKNRIKAMEDFLSIRKSPQNHDPYIINNCVIHLHYKTDTIYGEKRLDMGIGKMFALVQLELQDAYSQLKSLLGD